MDKSLDTPAQHWDEFEKRKHRRKKLFLLFSVIGFFLLGGVTIGVISIIRTNQVDTPVTKLEVLIDPILVTENSEQHINGGAQFVFGLDQESESISTQIERAIDYGEYICYCYELKNSGHFEVEVMLNLNVEQKVNTEITHKIDDGEINSTNQSIFNAVCSPNTTKKITIYIKIDNPIEDAYIKGSLILSLTEKGGI